MSVATQWLARRALAREAPLEQERLGIARALRAARIPIASREYRRTRTLASAGAAAGLASIVGAVLAFIQAPLVIILTAPLAAGMLSFLAVRIGFRAYPAVISTGRARLIDAEFHDVVILCYALAKGGLNALDVFRAVHEERETYGVAAEEFGTVVRGVEWFGQDINTALEDAAAATPSRALSGFFAGLVAILNSGADPKDYFRRQAELQLQSGDNRVERDLEQSGLLAESYVSGLLVLPLLLIIVIAVMSVFGGGKSALLKAIVFIFIPVGTLAYAILVDTLLPSESLAAPLKRPPPVVDFGLDVATRGAGETLAANMGDAADDAAPEGTAHARGWSAMLASMRRRSLALWKRFVQRARARPTDAFLLSVPAALLVFAGGAASLWLRGIAIASSLTTLVVFAGLIAIVPPAIFHEMRTHLVRKIEGALPETLSKLSGFSDRGISILQAFRIAGKSMTGPLAKELRAVDRDVTWNHHLRDALMRLRQRVGTPRVTRLSILLERASASTSDLKEVLDIAAQNASRTETMRARKRQGMMTYVVVIYVVFAVFLYVTYMVTNLFYGGEGFGVVTTGLGGAGLSKGIEPAEARLLFFQAVLIQGACCGVVAGRLGEGYVLSGFKHAAILVLAAWIVFALGVM